MLKKLLQIGIGLCFLVGVCGEARAGLITFDYQGRITQAGGGLSVGDPFSVTVTIDSTFAPQPGLPDPQIGQYVIPEGTPFTEGNGPVFFGGTFGLFPPAPV